MRRWTMLIVGALVVMLLSVSAYAGKGTQKKDRTKAKDCTCQASAEATPPATATAKQAKCRTRTQTKMDCQGCTGCTCDASNMADDDGDGVPNCQDPDYVPPQDGTGKQRGKK